MNYTNIAPGSQVTEDMNFPPLQPGQNCCTVRWTAVCGAETIAGEQEVCVETEEAERCKPSYHGLTFFPWSLNEQRLNSTAMSVAWAWCAPRDGFIRSATAYHRAEPPGVDVPGSYSEGNGGYVHYEMWSKGANDAPLAKIGTSQRIIGHVWQADANMTTQAPLVRASGNVGFNEYAFDELIPVTKGEYYFFSVRRQGDGVDDYVSMNGYIIDRDMYCSPDDPFFDDCQWHTWIQTDAGVWQRRITEASGADYRVGVFEVVYDDDYAVGQGHAVESNAQYDNNDLADRLYNLNSNQAYRLCWNRSTPIDIKELCIGLVPRTSPGIVDYRIVTAGGTVLRTGTINFAGAPVAGNWPGTGLAQNDWLLSQALAKRHDTFPCLTIPAGITYIEITTNSGTYEVAMNRDGAKSGFLRGGECSGFPDGYAEVSQNGGASWQATDQNTNNNNQYMSPAMYMVECV